MRLSTSIDQATGPDVANVATTREMVKGEEPRLPVTQNTPTSIRACLHMEIYADGINYFGPPAVSRNTWGALRKDLTPPEFRKPKIIVTIEIIIFPDGVIIMAGPPEITRGTWKAIQNDLMRG